MSTSRAPENGKKKKKSTPFCNMIKDLGFFFLIRPTCYVLYMEEEQSMINSTVQNSRAPKFSPQWQYIHDNPSSQYSTSHTQSSKSSKFSRKSVSQKLEQK